MASNILLKFADIAGESAQTDYTEWIECNSLSFGVFAPVAMSGTGLGSGKATFSGYSINTIMGAHSHEVLEKMLNGKHHVTIEIKVLKQTGDETGQPYWTLNGKKGYIESINWSAGPDGQFSESILFHPEEHSLEYFKQSTEDGTLTSTGAKTYNVQEAKTS